MVTPIDHTTEGSVSCYVTKFEKSADRRNRITKVTVYVDGHRPEETKSAADESFLSVVSSFGTFLLAYRPCISVSLL